MRTRTARLRYATLISLSLGLSLLACTNLSPGRQNDLTPSVQKTPTIESTPIASRTATASRTASLTPSSEPTTLVPPTLTPVLSPTVIPIVSTEDNFNSQLALRRLYPNRKVQVADTGVEVVIPRTTDTPPYTDTLKVILSEPFTQAGLRKHALLVASSKNEDSTHPIGAPISGGIFVQNGGAWKTEIWENNFTELGEWGYSPEVWLVQIGPQNYGLLFEPIKSGESSYVLYALLNGQFKEILAIPNIRVTTILDLQSGDGRSVDLVWSEYEWVEGANPEYYDFSINLHGGGVFQPKFEHKIYTFNGSAYVEH